MKKQSIYSGVILIGFGLYFLLQQYNVTFFPGLYTWPTLLIVMGIGFLLQGYIGKDYEAILPGVVLTGIGVHFHITSNFDIWPEHTGIFLLVIALGLLLTYVKTGKGVVQGTLFLIAAIFILFLNGLTGWALNRGYNISLMSRTWPILFIITGAYFTFFQRKK